MEQLPVAAAGDHLGAAARDPAGTVRVPAGGRDRLPPAHGRHHDRRCAHDHPVRHLPEVLRQWLRQLRHQVRRP
eukprot:Nk52_evm1s2234 gene=Nk52_evmTU1s2234